MQIISTSAGAAVAEAQNTILTLQNTAGTI